jgi:hypothetical protein
MTMQDKNKAYIIKIDNSIVAVIDFTWEIDKLVPCRNGTCLYMYTR